MTKGDLVKGFLIGFPLLGLIVYLLTLLGIAKFKEWRAYKKTQKGG